MSCSYVGVVSRRSYDTNSITLRNIYAYDISNNTPFSTGYILTSLKNGYTNFLSPLVALSTIGFATLPAEISTVEGELVSTINWIYENFASTPEFYLPSTVTGLATTGYISTSQLNSTITGLGSAGYLSSGIFTIPLASTVVGLGTLGYVSSLSLFSTVSGLGSEGYISSLSLISTVEGLGTAGYVSSQTLQSTIDGLGNIGYISSLVLLESTIAALSELGFVSTSQLTSTVEGLGTSGYVSTAQLDSTIIGLGSLGYASSIATYKSTFSNIKTFSPNYCNIAYLYTNLTANQSVNTISFDLGQALRDKIDVSTAKLDIELKTNLQFVYYDPTSRDYQFNNYLIRSSTFATSNIIGQESLTYYILNASPINLPYFFLPTSRFIIKDTDTLSAIRNDPNYSILSLVHYWAPRIPATNQFFVSPMSTACVTVSLDNTPSP